MKRVNSAVIAIILSCLTVSFASAGNKSIAGLAIGGGTGAVVGHAVGHNAESTILGATVGGVIGLIIGNELGRDHVIVHKQYHRPQTHYRPRHHSSHYRPSYRGKTHYYKQRWNSPRKHVKQHRRIIHHDRPLHPVRRDKQHCKRNKSGYSNKPHNNRQYR